MTTLVLGASENPARYSNIAVGQLKEAGHEVYAYALKSGSVHEIETIQQFPATGSVDTVTLYLGPAALPDYVQDIIRLKPRRVIFNPGTENPAVRTELEAAGINCLEACTLVMLRLGNYTD